MVTLAPPMNYTTKVPARRTAIECQDILVRAGATAVTLLAAAGQPAGLRFEIGTDYGPRQFELPVNAAGVAALLRRVDRDRAWPASLKPADKARYLTDAHARDVAWRTTKDWLEAQLAVIAANMVTVDQVMLPYMVTGPGVTVWSAYQHDQQSALPEGAGR